ncbi:MAG: HD domain-containing phosphohydrolase [Mycobacteriales bacterium]
MTAEEVMVTEEPAGDRWRARPVLAGSLRVLIVAIPLALGYLATVVCLHLLQRQVAENRWWLLVVIASSVLTCVGVERLTRRLMPLAALWKLSMLFPDRAPTRFKIARQAFSVKALAQKAAADPTPDASTSAEQGLALITALTAHDRRTRGHSERVRLFTELLAEELRLPTEARDKLRWASLLHDIGKLQVAVDILNKSSKLNSTEWSVVAEHPVTGEKLLGPLLAWLGEWGGAVRQHHEKYDGTGYPDRRAGTDICRGARIVSIADSFEVMTAHRAYKKPMATVAARAELARCSGKQFDPTYVRAFLAISLPRLLWAMGPASLLMNLPMLRTLADTANKGALATSQGGVLAASTVAVISGVAGAAVGNAPAPVIRPPHLVAAPRTIAPLPVGPKIPRPSPRATGRPASRLSGPISPPAPAPAPVPVPVPPSPPVAPPAQAVATVAFDWVPYPLISTTSASVGFTADAATARLICSLDGGTATICTGSSMSYSNLSDGLHVVRVTPQDAAGISGQTISTSFTVDITAANVAWTSVPPPQVSTSSVTLRFVSDDPDAVTWCSVDGSAATTCVSPLVLNGLADGAHAVSVYAVDASGNVGAAIQTSFTVDAAAPVVTITSSPPSTITVNSASVSFTVDDPSASTLCSLDGAPATACTSPISFSGLADGSHTVAIHAVDPLGNVGNTVNSTFTVDTTAPVVTSISAPTAPVPSSSVSIPFSLDDSSATAWCSLDGASATVCTSPVTYNGLADGAHTIAVYAVDPAGNVGATVSASFTISATAPTVTLTNPPALTNSNSVNVSFTVDDPTATAWCSLDGAAASTCTSPVGYSGLADGSHTIDVYAVSASSQQGATASASFVVDTTAPTVTITSAPSGRVRSSQASLAFTVDEPSATTWCKIDSGAAAACTSPWDLSSLAEGSHTVSVYAVDPAGNVGASKQASFIIDDTAPTVTLATTPPSSSASRTATVSFTTNDATATAWCALDSGAVAQCSGTVTYSGLGNGSHTIRVYAVDPAGNRGPTASTTFTVTASAPVLLTTPPAKSGNKTVTFTWWADPALTYQYSYDGVTWLPTTGHFYYTATLKNGTYTFQLRGVDAYGAPTAVTSYTFRVT